MCNYMYISLGNNCTVSIALRELDINSESLPFDSVISNPRIIYDCLHTNFSHFINIKSAHKEYRTDNLLYYYPKIKSTFPGFPMTSLENEYGIKFHHYFGKKSNELVTMFQRRINRFNNLLSCSDTLIFFYCVETYIYDNISRENKDTDYEYLQKIDEYLSNNYCGIKFTIVNFTLNETRDNSKNIVNLRIDFPVEYFSDNCETHRPDVFKLYRKLVSDKIKEYVSI